MDTMTPFLQLVTALLEDRFALSCLVYTAGALFGLIARRCKVLQRPDVVGPIQVAVLILIATVFFISLIPKIYALSVGSMLAAHCAFSFFLFCRHREPLVLWEREN